MGVVVAEPGLSEASPPLAVVPDPLEAPPQPDGPAPGQRINLVPDPPPQDAASQSAANQDAASSASAPQGKPAYPPPAEVPTQHGPHGLRFDFNSGCRVSFPASTQAWKVRLSDLDTGNILYQTEISQGWVNSSKHYYVRFRVEVWQQDKLLLTHDYSAADREVLIQFPIGTLGDTMGWLPYAAKFQEQHRCRLTCAIADKLIPLFRDAYPNIKFVNHEGIKPEDYYATYSMGLFFDDKDHVYQPCDFRYVG